MSRPFLDKKATDQLNLSVLRRVDPDTEQSRKDVEGSLFLLKRQTQPRFKIIILNKKSQDNFVEDVLGDFKFEVAAPYVLYRSKLDEVIGIWFYDQNECATVAGLLQRITAAYAGQPSPSETTPTLTNLTSRQSNVPTPPDDAFWDKRNTDATPASANARARLLQPAHQAALTPGTPPNPAHADTSPDGEAVQSAFASEGSMQPGEGAASHHPQQDQGDLLRKLLLSQPGSADGGVVGSPPRPAPHGLPAVSSPTHQKAAEPGAAGEGQSPLSALFANIKVSSSGGPAAQTPPPQLRAPQGSAAPPAHSPALLTPSFFRQQSNPQEVSLPSTSESALQEAGNSLQQVFARAASKSTPRTDQAEARQAEARQAEASLQSQVLASVSSRQSDSARDRIREVLIELANSNTFLDMIVDQLQSKGLQL